MLESHNFNWYNNKTGDDAGIVAGNLGYETSEIQKLSPVNVTVSRSEFGNGLRIIGGHVGSNGAEDFFKKIMTSNEIR